MAKKDTKCKVCGCTENDSCFHPAFGNCWWVQGEEDLCSHCDLIKNDNIREYDVTPCHAKRTNENPE